MPKNISTAQVKKDLRVLGRYHAAKGDSDLYTLATRTAEVLPRRITPTQLYWIGINQIIKSGISATRQHYYRLIDELVVMAETVLDFTDASAIREAHAGIKKIREEKAKAEKSTGFVPYISGVLGTYLRKLIESGSLNPGSNFLDLGAGRAERLLEAAESGLDAYGIEITPALVEAANIKIEAAKGRLNGRACKVTEGSYYPRDYIELREKGQAFALEYEREFFDRHESLQAQKDRIFHPVASVNDPFEELGIAFSEVDAFWSYTWGPELASQIEILSMFAKTGAFLLNVSANHPLCKQLLDELNLVERLGLSRETLSQPGELDVIVKYTKM